ncbi:F-box protein At3g07870-like isoform X1 [Juglans microcarpa x Juglans regia]|uniref:F-box protein At3g07870-like isoform X1 n=1 Tax=Juglans microcarpa x Juglans regia TaxID=2249226 RepID=UPI001B7ED4E5|nr:F-box protein At3g07870-like isoform X1 [Juglans microcarpa x Juglans regia]
MACYAYPIRYRMIHSAYTILLPVTTNQHLPKSAQYQNQRVVFGFGFNSTTKEYKVLKIVYYRKACAAFGFSAIRDSEVQILTMGSSAWRSLGKAGYHLYQWPSQVFVNGRLHWVTWPHRHHRGSKIILFDLEDERFREVPSTTLKVYDYHLVVLGGCLSTAVYFNYCKLEIWVMTEYDVEGSWVKKFNIRAYVPVGLEEEPADQFYKNSKIIEKGEFVRVLCLLKNGEILLEYESRALVSYDPKGGEFKDLMFQGIPTWYQRIVHMGSLKWIDTFTDA